MARSFYRRGFYDEARHLDPVFMKQGDRTSWTHTCQKPLEKDRSGARLSSLSSSSRSILYRGRMSPTRHTKTPPNTPIVDSPDLVLPYPTAREVYRVSCNFDRRYSSSIASSTRWGGRNRKIQNCVHIGLYPGLDSAVGDHDMTHKQYG